MGTRPLFQQIQPRCHRNCKQGSHFVDTPNQATKEKFLLQTALRDKMKESLDIVVLLGCCHLSQNARHLVHLRITRRSGFSSHLIEDFLCFGGV